MTNPNFRALCAELLQAIEDDVIDTNDGPRFQAAVDRARAALPQMPTDEELTWLWNHVATNRRQRMTWFDVDCLPETDYQQFARSVLRQWGRPATELEAQ